MEQQVNRAARRAAAKRAGRYGRRAGALAATGVLAAGLLGAGAGIGAAAGPLDALGDLGGITEILDNEMVRDFVEICTAPDGSTPVIDAEHPPVAVADCSQSTGGTGVAVVLPDSVEIGGLLEGYDVDLSDVPVLNLGTKNMIELLSGLALGSSTTKDIIAGLLEAAGQKRVRIDPGAIGIYSSYEQIRAHAALEPLAAAKDVCVRDDGSTANPIFGVCVSGTLVRKNDDQNRPLRANALKMVEYLSGEKFDSYDQAVDLPAISDLKPRGSATVVGDGVKVAVAMRGGTALATANEKFGIPGIAMAAADHGASATASAAGGIATALNADTDQLKLTFFGRELDLTQLKGSGALDLAGEDGAGLIDQIDGLVLPGLKEVSCFGLSTSARADGFGACSNFLGTLDSYQDLRPAGTGDARQRQFGFTDVTSLVLGNDALLKQIDDADFLDGLMGAITSEDQRLKLAKDFFRFTEEVRTGAQKVDPKTGEPLVDEAGRPVYETTTVAYLTSDYGLREPISIDWLGYRLVIAPWTETEVNGAKYPNLLALPQLRKIEGDAERGLLPKISLVTWDHPFGLGTVDLSNPFDPLSTLKKWWGSVTLIDDVKGAGALLGGDAAATVSDAGLSLGSASGGSAPAESGTGSAGVLPLTSFSGGADSADHAAPERLTSGTGDQPAAGAPSLQQAPAPGESGSRLESAPESSAAELPAPGSSAPAVPGGAGTGLDGAGASGAESGASAPQLPSSESIGSSPQSSGPQSSGSQSSGLPSSGSETGGASSSGLSMAG